MNKKNILNLINGPNKDIFVKNFELALQGKFIQEECIFQFANNTQTWWNISFVPAIDKEGTLFGVSFNATNISENKGHLHKINTQMDALNKIAHVQSHDIRGPLASILGLMNIIREEKIFNEEYLSMLEDAVKAFDKQIHNMVDYTRQHN